MEKETKIRQVEEHLMQYGSITPMESLAYYNLYRLSDTILKLRRRGMNIETVSTGKAGYATYRLIR